MEIPSQSGASPLFGASIASALLLVTACLMTLATGVSQQWFEVARAPDVYAAALVHDATPLRAIVAVDDLFIAAYVTATVLLAIRLGRPRLGPLQVLVLAGGVAAGVLDLEENHHLLAMLRVAEEGIAIPLQEIVRRTDLSQLKWMIGHLTFVFVGVSLQARDAVTRAFRASLVGWQLPIGVLCWTVSAPAWGPALAWARYLAVLAGFAVVALLSRRDGALRGDAVAVGSSAPA
jgi:hypothetical protein